MLVVENGRRLGSCVREPQEVDADELFAFVVLADPNHPGAWEGWLTTLSHRSICFSAADLEDAGFRRWLACLPGWEPEKLAQAATTPGLHLVWRRTEPWP